MMTSFRGTTTFPSPNQICQSETLCFLDNESGSEVQSLQLMVGILQASISVEIGFSSFNDHNGCYFRAVDEAEFRLSAREIGIQWRRPLSNRSLNASTDLL